MTRVMLLRNIDINGNLVNGVMGTVTGCIKGDRKRKEIKSILVRFDDPTVGEEN